MRRGLLVGVTAALLLTLSVPVGAGPPIRESFDFFNFSCELSGENGEGFVFVAVEESPEGRFTFADATIWLPGSLPFESEPDMVSDFEGSEAFIEGDNVSALIPMIFTETGEPDGVLTLEGSVGALLDEEMFSERFRDGNRWVESTETIQFFEATGTAMLDGLAFETSCSAQLGHVESRSTNPHAFRVDFKDAFAECFGIIGSDGSTLDMFAGEFEDQGFLDMQIYSAEGNGDGEPIPDLFGSTEIPALVGSIDVVVPLFDPFGEGDPVTEAHVSMTIVEGEIFVSDIVFQDGRVKETRTELLVSGSVHVDIDGRSFDLSECSGERLGARGIINEAAGPKAKGAAPDNDAPGGAWALGVGQRINQQTKTAALEPEAACSIIFEFDEENGEVFDLPMGKTVWYEVEGTGGPLTVSTAGSHFDTIVGVYTEDGGTLEQVACVDDVFNGGFSLQAEVTWNSEPGQTYLVQAGGFGFFEDPEFPEFESLPEYGLLKISLSG